ncbi:8-amino-7-oxononanoate synthase [Noviherbaspirillum pedocola]|uniref:8-amino-7-oxononanoate synthase n=1 Tax=Noviherbaspirillum pedocola TaxID=2801341 RepID=A0A934WA86_9BURK|nr:8-amino-7-oxononanoate synthase [Noviherbaspirillum pedocola]MBK4738294.1 8-amino-7-oxononanoate synthase [Noviherbaspirillum pedocola]
MNPLLQTLEAGLRELDAVKLRRRRRTVDTPCGPRAQVDGRPMLAFCSNDYLGLASHPALVEALQEGASRYGVGSGASHLISGHGRAHAQLEERLAEFEAPYIEEARALYFCTGYMANLAVLTALAPAGADIFCEELNHASLIDGARLARGNVHVYPHRDLSALETMLKDSRAATKLVVTDSVFSMDGVIAPLPQLLALCERYGAWLVVDDAHGFGVLGEHGRGALEHFGLRSPKLVYIGTLGKAAGVGGAFVAAHATVIEWLLQRGRTYIYTTAAPPALAHALLTSVDLIAGPEGAARRARLAELNARFRDALQLKRWKRMASETPIQPILIGESGPALEASAALERERLWVPAIRPPTVPKGTARLRVTFSGSHEIDDARQLADALNHIEGTLHG